MASTLIQLKRGATLYDYTSHGNTNTTTLWPSTLSNTWDSTNGKAEPWFQKSYGQLWVDNICINPHLSSGSSAISIDSLAVTGTNPYEILQPISLNINPASNTYLTQTAQGLTFSWPSLTSKMIIGGSSTATANISTSNNYLTNQSVYLNHIHNLDVPGGTVTAKSSIKLTAGTGVTLIYTAPSGNNTPELKIEGGGSGNVQLSRTTDLTENNKNYRAQLNNTVTSSGSTTTTMKWGLIHEALTQGVGSMVTFREATGTDKYGSGNNNITESTATVVMSIEIIDGGTF